jgi:hypothetical protein
MSENEFAPAGWMAIAGAILTLPLMAAAFVLDIVAQKVSAVHPMFPVLYVGLSLIQIVLLSYAFYRFKVYLNELHDFHRTDVLILVIIAGAVAITTVALTGKALAWSGAPTPILIGFIVGIVAIGIPLGILTVIFGIKILELEDDLYGLLKPYAFINIVAGVCFATFILSPLGGLLLSVANVMLGMILLKKGSIAQPDFV